MKISMTWLGGLLLGVAFTCIAHAIYYRFDTPGYVLIGVAGLWIGLALSILGEE